MADYNFELLHFVDVPTFVLEIDSKGDAVYVAYNQTALDNAGFKISDVLGKTARELYPGRLGLNTYNRHKRIARSGVETTNDFTLPLSSGLKNIRTTLRPIKDSEGRVSHLVGTSMDITNQQALQETHAQSLAITNDMEDFVGMAAHDLRAPLRNMRTMTDLLREDFQDLGDGKLELVNLLSKVSVKSMDLISDVLSYSTATQALLDKAAFDFKDMCTDIMSVLDPQDNCRVHISGDWIYCDRTAVQITVRNLVDNALKYANSGHLEIWIAVIANDQETLKITVQDNGHGFDDSATEFLNGGELRVNGGFGLLGVRRLIRARGGTLEAKNRKDCSGAELTITLPGKIVRSPQ